MKKSILTAAVVFLSVVTFGNSNNFEKLMKQNLKIVRVNSDNTNYQEQGDKFAKIAESNNKRFEPYYYSAYCYILNSWQVTELNMKLEILGAAKKQIDIANRLSPDNDEILVLEAFYYQAMIMMDPANNGQKYSMKAEELLRKAQAINKNNPRAEFLRAQNVYYRPAQYGGGKEKALPLFEKAAIFFKRQNTNNYLNPIWGEKTNRAMVKQCTM